MRVRIASSASPTLFRALFCLALSGTLPGALKNDKEATEPRVPPVEIRVTLDLLASHVAEQTNYDFLGVEWSRTTPHFLEDFTSHRGDGTGRTVNQALAKPSFRYFYFEGGRLHRYFFIDEGAAVSAKRFVSLRFIPREELARPTFRLYRGAFSNIEAVPPGCPTPETMRALILARVKSEIPRLLRTDLSALYAGDRRHFEPLHLSEAILFQTHHRFGLPAMEFMGRRGPAWLFRAPLALADTELARREWDIAHAYVVWLEWRAARAESAEEGERLVLSFTRCDFSIYTK